MGVLATSLLMQGCAFVLLASLGPDEGRPFLEEALILVAVSAVLAVPCSLLRTVRTFRLAMGFRVICAVAALAATGGVPGLIPVLLSIPLLLEIVSYDSGRIRWMMVGTTFVLLLAGRFSQLDADDVHASAREFAAFAIILVVGTGGAISLDHYRETVVRQGQLIRSMEATVTNLSHANKAFQSYADNLESESAAKERNRIIGELHDTIGYALTNVNVMMKAGIILIRDDPDQLADLLNKVREQSSSALNDVRRTLHQMKAIQQSEPKGLHAIYGLTNAFQGATGIRVEVNRGNMPWSLGQRLDSVVFRCVQEALTNAFRHGKATEVTVTFWRAADELRIAVRDNGVGAAIDGETEEGMGLSGIRERLREYGGTLRTGNVGGGFELQARIPYRAGGIREPNQGPDR